jgi:hypothetical protein
MNSELEQYKAKISNYSVSQLEEILVSLNKHKFPQKYELVQGTLERKKGPAPSPGGDPSEEEAEKTEVASPRISKSDETAVREPETPPSPEASGEKAGKEAPADEAGETTRPKPTSIEVDTEDAPDLVFPALATLAILTTLFAVYLLLAAAFELPGKQAFVDIGNKLPGSLTSSR